ncbi:MAG: hypothetical protein K2X43_03915 [Hyphomonadaceae bacterium]|nr:hypothetical protein [Hyphomonadaceae bacterium]
MAFTRSVALSLITVAGSQAYAAMAQATQINTGGEAGAYHASFCPALAGQLKLAQFDYRCVPSAGTRENIDRITANPRQLGFGQLDVFALESRLLKAEGSLTLVRQDDVRECVFAVTRNKQISNWGELSVNAGSLRYILPPATSGSAGTFQFLRTIDAEGLGRSKAVTHAPSTEDAIRQALSAEDTASLFVEFPDPESKHFELVRKLGGHLVPVIDRTILRQEIGGTKIYYPQETEIESAGWIQSARKLATACTPLVVFTGAADRVHDETARKDHADLIRTVAAMKRDSLLPQESFLDRALKRTKELSAISTERALELTDQAREKAKPYTDKAVEKAKEIGEQAKQAAERAGEAAKPYVEKTKEAAQKAYDEALRLGKDLIDKAKPDPAQKKD